MKRTEAQSIGDILRIALQENCMSSRLDECKAVDLWEPTVGTYIASQCRRPVVKDGVMTVGIPNAPLRHELSMNRSKLRDAINRQIGKQTLSEIRFSS
ncbi:MAG: DUF721 domain-containing protein [Muribaculaceae bacterium]|nr:DUF721 domain-containing protein [Muribaculaceae bacterium]MDE6755284.1 DUF721 domain-containing protein [Muribaculaceae bacterium]